MGFQLMLEEFECGLRPNDWGRLLRTASEAWVKPRLTMCDSPGEEVTGFYYRGGMMFKAEVGQR